MKAFYFEVYVEGGMHARVKTLRAARCMQRRLEKEGWNIKIIKVVETIVGLMGVQQ